MERSLFLPHHCVALGLSPAATTGGLFYAVSRHVEERAEECVHPVFLLDEAHLLHQDTLEHLHILLNYHWDSRALLSLVLVGARSAGASLTPSMIVVRSGIRSTHITRSWRELRGVRADVIPRRG